MEINFLKDDASKFNQNDDSIKNDSKESAKFLKPKTTEETVDVVPDAYKDSSEDMFDEKKSGSKLWLIIPILVVLGAGGYFGVEYFLLNKQVSPTEIDDGAVDDQEVILNDSIVSDSMLVDSISSTPEPLATDSIYNEINLPEHILDESVIRESIGKIVVSLLKELSGTVEIEHINLQSGNLFVEFGSNNKSDLDSYIQSIKNSSSVNTIKLISESTQASKFVSLYSITGQEEKSQTYQQLLTADQLKSLLEQLLGSTDIIEFETASFSDIPTFIIRANTTRNNAIKVYEQSISNLKNSKFLKLSIVAIPDNKFQLNMMIQLVE